MRGTGEKIHPVLEEAAAVFARHRRRAYLVGGAIRDMILGRPHEDWDLATDAPPEEVMAMFPRVIPTGLKHGTVTVRLRDRRGHVHSLEITTFRTESAYSDGRRPDQVRYAATIEEDLSRRDFTMNALALPLPRGELIDLFGGQEDIRAHRIRCVGRAAERFAEDGLRPLRALRFASQLGFTLEEGTFSAIPGALETMKKVAIERVREELDKIIGSAKPSTALLLMEKTGILALFLPELCACRGIEQKGFHRFDVLDHSLLACDYAAVLDVSPAVRLAALFHDIGKPLVRRLGEEGVWTFHRHEAESARLTEALLLRFRYPGDTVRRVTHLVREHMFHYEPSWSNAAVRRFVIRAGEENLPDLFALRRCDAFAFAAVPPPADLLLPLQRRVEAALAQSRALSLKDLAVTGRDLLALGVPPGPRVGIVLQSLLEAVVEDPAQNDRQTLLKIARNLITD